MNVFNVFFCSLILGASTLFLGGCKDAADEAAAPAEPEPATGELFTQPLQTAKDPATVLAIVNETEITQAQLDKEINQMMTRMQGRVPPERLDQMRMQMEEQMLDNLVNRQVLLDKVASENITVSDEDFDTAISELTANLPENVTLDDMLAQAGSTKEEFRENFSMELKIRKLIEGQSGGKIEATEEEARTFYDENKAQFEKPESVKASHILITVEEGASDEDKAAKRAELEALRTTITEGADFADVAREHSSCPSKAQGGDLGEFTRGRMVPEFEAAAFSQPIDEVGDIVETQFGFHLIKVTSRSEGGTTEFDEVKEQLVRYLGGQKQQKSARELVEKLVSEAKISYPGRP